ncbi:T9SS type A sorting domain-containing protein, partial [Ekhidna sp. MALMAid0563]|uniref:T9SS type A sorting domain-containing protein n=1 Tax=Ekhidna sp. MALMAid0563 TaxID=3143937 RepID=UPI0032DFECE1
TETFTHDGTAEEIAAETVTVASSSGATDLVGLADVGDTSPSFAVDTQIPTFVDATYYDTDQDGSVDEILLEFSEDIDEASVSDTDFNIGSAGYGVVSFGVVATPANNGVDLNDTDNFITLGVNTGTTADQTIEYTQGGLTDEAGNLAATDLAISTIDLAVPVLTDVQIEDTDDDALIDRVVYVFSEVISDADDTDTYVVAEVGSITLPDGQAASFLDGDISLSNDGTYGYVTINNISGQLTANTAIGSLNVSGVNGSWDDDQGQTSIGDGAENYIDAASPIILSTSITSNAYADINFSEGVYGNAAATLPVDDTDFTIDIDGTVTAETVVSVKNTTAVESDDLVNVLVGGESTVRVFFSFNQPNAGGETVTFDTDGSLYDDSNNTAAVTQFTPDNQDVLVAPDIPDLTIARWLDEDGDGDIDAVEYTFNIDWDIDEAGSNDSNDPLDCFEIRNNGVLVTQDNFDYDSETTNGFYAAGAFAKIYFDGDQQPGTSIENLTLEYVTGVDDRIESQSTEDDAIPGDTPETYLDGAAPLFSGFTATILDTDTDGNVDQIQVDTEDHIDDSAINPAEFTYNGVAAVGVANVDNTDKSFYLVVNGNGTAVEGDFVYTVGTLVDTAANASDGGTILAASITDGAGPVVLDALTTDNDLNGQIDEITVTFSEAFDDLGIDDSDFSLSGGYTIPAAGFSVSSPDVILTVNESGSSDTYITPDVTVAADILEDQSAPDGANNPAQTFTNTSDGAAPYVTVDIIGTTSDATPDLSGTVDDPTATVLVNVGSNVETAINNGAGVWTLAGSELNNPLSLGIHQVVLTAFDFSTNIGTDTQIDEVEIIGGVVITGPSVVDICIGSETTLSTITLDETNNTDFSTSGSFILNLPAGFVYNTGASLSIQNTNASGNVTIGTVEYIGSSSLSIDLINDGNDDEDDVITIDGLIVQATGSTPRSNSLISIGGDVGYLTGQTSIGDLSSQAIEPTLANVQETSGGTFVTEWIQKYTATTVIPHGAITLVGGNGTFDDSESVSFSGGATGIIVPGTSTGSQIEIYLTSGTTVTNGETVTGAGGDNAVVNAAPSAGSGYLQPFGFTASTTGTPEWRNAENDAVLSTNGTVTNTDLGMTGSGMYSIDVYDFNAGCYNIPLRLKVLIYDDLDTEIFASNTFEDRSFISTNEVETIYLSQPAGTSATVSGAGITVTNPSATELTITFDPSVVASETIHPITYTIENDITGDQFVEVVNFEVSDPSQSYVGVTLPDDVFGVDDLPISFTLEQTDWDVGQNLSYHQYLSRTNGSSSGNWYHFSADYPNHPTGPFTFKFDPRSVNSGDPFTTWNQYSASQYANGYDDIPKGSARAFMVRTSLTNPSVLIDQNLFIYGEPLISLNNMASSYCYDDASFDLTREATYATGFSGNTDIPNSIFTPIIDSDDLTITTGYYLYKKVNTIAAASGSGYAANANFIENPVLTNNTTYFIDIFDASGDGIRFVDAINRYFTVTDASGDTVVHIGNQAFREENILFTTGAGAGEFDLPLTINLYTDNAANEISWEIWEYTLHEDFTGGDANGTGMTLQNDFDPSDPDQDGTGTVADGEDGDYRILYYSEALTPAMLSGKAVFDVTIFPSPSEPFLNASHNLSWNGAPWIDTTDPANGFDSYVMEFCSPSEVSFIVGENSSITYNWYANDQTTLLQGNQWFISGGVAFDDPSTGGVTEVPTAGTETVFYFATLENGCESALKKITVYIYEDTDTPQPTAASLAANGELFDTNHYIYDYCDDYDNTNIPIILETADESPSNPGSRNPSAYFNLYSEDAVLQTTNFSGTNLTSAVLGIPSTGNVDTTIFVTQVWNDQTPGATGTVTEPFEGCESDLVRFDINVTVTPSQPLAGDFVGINATIIHICQNDAVSNITTSDASNPDVDQYVWYDNDGGGGVGAEMIRKINGGSITQAQIVANSSFDPAVVGQYSFFVTKISGLNEDTSFSGCETTATEFIIEVHPIDDADFPVIGSTDYTDLGDEEYDLDTDADHLFPVCITELDPSATLDATSAYGGTKEFVWYQSNSTFASQVELLTATSPTFDQLGMGLGDITGAQSKYFIVTQRLDPDDFSAGQGCESGLATTYLEVRFSDLSALTMDVNNGTSPDWCYDDANPTFDLLVGGTSVSTLPHPMGGNQDPNLQVSYAVLLNNSVLSDTLDLDPTAGENLVFGSGNITTDFLNWHIAKSGNSPDGSGNIVGGASSVHYILMQYTDPATNCVGNEIFTLTVHPDPPTSFTLNGLDQDQLEFAYNDPTIDLEGFNFETGLGLSENTGSFLIDTDGLGVTNSNKTQFDPSTAHDFVHPVPNPEYAGQSSHQITFQYTNEYGCLRDTVRTVYVNPLPEILDNEIKTANTCADNDVELFVDVVPNEHGEGVEVYDIVWEVNGSVVQSLTAGTPDAEILMFDLGPLGGQANFSVYLTYNTGVGIYNTAAQSSVEGQSIVVGEAPTPSITWVGTTTNNPSGTDFRITEDNSGLPDTDVNYIEFFINGISQYSNDESVTPITFPLDINHGPGTGYQFTSAGTYPVRVIMETTAGCTVDFSRNIEITDNLPGITSYTEDFESGDGGWTIETLSIDGKSNTLATSWEIGTNVPDSTGGATFDGSNAVYTNGYQSSEVSFVYSPSFDLSAFSAPTISFLRYEDFETFRDGVVFQMSVDDGRTWVNVGGFDDAQPEGLKSTPNWYNREAITSAPGTVSPGPQSVANNAQGIGWAENSDWKEAIAPLAIPAGQEQYVRFRFALAAQATPKTTNGFAFDLVQIYDREQVVLVEQFSSTLSQDSYDINGLIDAAPIFNGNDILRINYFTDFANSGDFKDALNQRNTSAPGARSSYYGIEDIPSISISGDAQLISNASQLSGSIAAQLTNAKLVNPGFDISINASIDAENVLTVGANFTAISELPRTDTKLGLFLAILEPEIVVDNTMGSIGLYQVGDAITNVLRKMLPSAAGQFEQGAVAINDVLTIEDMTWPVSNMYVMDTLTVVAYVQDLSSKQVLQSEVLGLSNPNTELALGLNELTDFSLYPNPADKEVTVEFADVLREKTEWVIFDQAGREVLKGELDKGTKTMTVQTSEMPSGLYFIHLYAEDRKRQSKRIMVLH